MISLGEESVVGCVFHRLAPHRNVSDCFGTLQCRLSVMDSISVVGVVLANA
jgi:hypothetical protein